MGPLHRVRVYAQGSKVTHMGAGSPGGRWRRHAWCAYMNCLGEPLSAIDYLAQRTHHAANGIIFLAGLNIVLKASRSTERNSQ